MKVTLAGATIDRRFWKEDRAATPETISAAYARLSHSPKTIPELRDDAVSEVDKARRSNENIVYRMGHNSVAEHAVFNIDVEDASRLLVEFIERHRLASFTERSQRYVFFGNKTYIIPDEVAGTHLQERVMELEKEKFELYREVVSREDLKEKFQDRLLEQARYILGLTCPTDLGLTVNARETEYIISQGLAHPLSEVRRFATSLLGATAGLAPSLVKYTEGNFHVQRTSDDISRVMEGMARFEMDKDGKRKLWFNPNRRVVCSDLPSQVDDPESEVVAGLIFESSDLSIEESRCLARNLSDEQLMDLLLPVFKNYPVHSSLPRAFEMMDLTFDFDISASGFAQLKRHRMATILSQRYDPCLWETPEIYMEDPALLMRYWALMKRSRDLYHEIKAEHGTDVAQYVLTNGHKRRVVFKLNLREMYHFVRLRSDHHAQDEIRRISDMMVNEMEQRFPLVASMLCGKDRFGEGRGRLFGCEGKYGPEEGEMER
ncbi:MAG: FAD-dependent thymidylate synthase [Candidatus Thermoplasmatota archaeon]|nr:FAD-dependent thymidylate synthase [Candidatus Thermoplasmatota archaeon]